MQGRFGAARAALVGGSVVLLALALWAPAAVAGKVAPAAPLTIVKTVSGPVPASTTFTATIKCDDEFIIDGNDHTDSVAVSFDATGQPTSEDTFGFSDPTSCTVTETEDGGASTTTYACESTLPDTQAGALQEDPEPICPEAGPVSDPVTVNIVNEEQTATVTIHNTFTEPPTTTTTTTAPPAPQAAPAVVAQARFTG
jgi:hypothetical protein